jgi:hypothetical protein
MYQGSQSIFLANSTDAPTIKQQISTRNTCVYILALGGPGCPLPDSHVLLTCEFPLLVTKFNFSPQMTFREQSGARMLLWDSLSPAISEYPGPVLALLETVFCPLLLGSG